MHRCRRVEILPVFRARNVSVGFLIAGVWLVIGLLAYSQLPQMLNSGLDNDHLIIFDHWHQFFRGSLRPWEWVFSRLPSLLPDYGLSFVLALGTPSWQASDYLTRYWVLQFSLIACLLLLLVLVFVNPANRIKAVISVSLVSLVATCLSPGFRFAVMMTGLPVNHGGNALNSLAALVLVGAGLRQGLIPRRWFSCVLFAYGLLVGFSNRMFLLQFLAPLGLVLFISGFPSEQKRYWAALASGALGGGVVLYGLVIHQCSDPSAGEVSSRWMAAAAGLQMLWDSGAWLVFLVGLTSSGLLLSRSKDGVNSKFLPRFYLVFVAFCLGIFLFLVPDSGLVYLRYLLAPLWLTPLLVGLALSEVFGSFCELAGLGVFASTAFLFVGTKEPVLSAGPVLDARHRWAAERLRQGAYTQAAVLAVSPAWESRALGLALGRPGDVLSVSTDGNPMLWPHAREEYIKSRKSRYAPSPWQIRDFRLYLGSPEDKSSLAPRLGIQGPPLDCYEGRYCLWSLPEALAPERKRFFVGFFSTQADDRWRCFNTDASPLKRFLLQIKRLFTS